MFPQYGTLKDIVPLAEGLSRLPGKLLWRTAALFSMAVMVMGWSIAQHATGFGAWLPFTLGALGLVISLFFAWRRYRLERAVTQWLTDMQSTVNGQTLGSTTDYSPMFDGPPSSSTDISIIDEDGTPLGEDAGSGPAENAGNGRDASGYAESVDSAAQRNFDAMMEETQRRDTWMPGIEAAQRAAVAAAGGTVNAPFLRDDLRITLVSAIATGAVIPIEVFIGIFAFFALL